MLPIVKANRPRRTSPDIYLISLVVSWAHCPFNNSFTHFWTCILFVSDHVGLKVKKIGLEYVFIKTFYFSCNQ